MGFFKVTCQLLLASTTSARWIVPGGRWTDTKGEIINAHAGGITVEKDTGKFFWFGEWKPQGQVEGGGFSVYSSYDLATWEHHGLALTPDNSSQYISPHNVIQRPKVTYSEGTGKYHMWWHADNSTYGWLLQGFAQSDTIAGPYKFVDAISPLGNWSQDFGLFVDKKDGRAYSLYSNGDRKEARDCYISLFNENITNVEKVVHRFDKYDLEGPTIVQTDKSYYALMSHKTGYRPNNVVAFRADSLSGPWSQPWIVAPLNTRTFNSQSGFALTITGTETTTHLYIGDQWDSISLWESRYIWLPINIDDEKRHLSLEWHDVYDLNVTTGVVTPINGTTYYGADATTTGDAFHQEAPFGANGTILTGIAGNASTAMFHSIVGAGPGKQKQWVSFYYQNTDDMGFGDQPGGTPDRIGGTWQLRRIAWVSVNGGAVQSLYQRDTHKGILLSSPLLLELDEGENQITIGGLFNGWDVKGADLDRLVVYPPEPL